MRNIISTLVLLLALVFGRIVQAETISIIGEPKPVTIGYGQTEKFQFGTVPQANTTVLLKIKSRMDSPGLGGSMHFLRISLNGREVKPAKSRYIHRLLNKPLSSPVTPSLTYSWFDEARGWNVLYAPDFQAAYGEKYYVDDPYVYVLDVTDLTNPVAENRIEITNTATLNFIQTNKIPNDKLDMVVASVEIETKPGSSPLMSAPENSQTVINRGEPGAGPAPYRGELLPGGGFAVNIGKSSYRFSSSFSFPDAGFNRLAAGPLDKKGQKAWTVTRQGDKIVAHGPDYDIVRTVKFGARRVEVSDTITNRHRDAALGLSVRHELDISDFKNAPVRLAGNPDPTLTDYTSIGNPSVHVTVPQGALGMIVDDAVFRCQAKLYTREDPATKTVVAGLRTEMLRLAPGETYSVKWSLYPVAGRDYYDFVNLVRSDWGANYTAWGTWVWGFGDVMKLSPEELRARIKRQGIRYFIGADWVEWSPNPKGTQRIALGSDVFTDYWAERRQYNLNALKKLRQVAPEVKVLGYLNAMRDSREDAAQLYGDSFQVDEAGKPLTTMWTYTGATNGSHTMIPTLNNQFGKAMLKVADRYIDDMQLDGIYWDEVEGILFGEILKTYNNFDGHSCQLDPVTWRIKREVGIVPLANRPFINEMVRRVQKKGKILLGNGPTSSRDTLRDHVQRMTEVQHNEYYAFEGNLQPPLGYMSSAESWDDYLRALRMAMLPAMGFSTELPHDLAGFLFPFTPIELHSGYLLGKERIVAEHSGNYGWKGERVLVQARHFDATGKLSTADFKTIIGGEARTAVNLGAKEAIVLERLPLRFGPKSVVKNWQAEASQVTYNETAVSLNLKALQGGTLTLYTGVLPVVNGSSMAIQMGSRPQAIVRVGKAPLQVSVPSGFSGMIRITQVP